MHQLTKHCNLCDRTLPSTEFYADRSKRSGLTHCCKGCSRTRQRAWRDANPEHHTRRYWANRDSERERHLKKKYGVTFPDYAAMLAEQGGGCAICKRAEPQGRMLDVDHDHATGEVRGLLCTSCNRMLGHAGDSAERLRSGAAYLESCRPSPRSSSKPAKG